MNEFAKQALQTAISTIISGGISMFLLYYLRRYIDKKSDDEEAERTARDEQRKQRAIAEAERRQKAGRLFFWLYLGIKKPPANGELDAAMKEYEEAEQKQKALERAMIADFDIKDS
jgi:phosphate/sulfate permease